MPEQARSAPETPPAPAFSLTPSLRGLTLLWRRSLAEPRQVSMVAPSSRFVGRAAAALIRQRPRGGVIELGAGTGAITRALLEHGIAAQTLTCLELDATFCRHLRDRLPQLDIICAPAERLAAIWCERASEAAGAVVSSLPIRLFEAAQQATVLDACRQVLAPAGLLVQATYRPSTPIPYPLLFTHGFAAESRLTIWRNLPPVFLWTYRRLTPAAGDG